MIEARNNNNIIQPLPKIMKENYRSGTEINAGNSCPALRDSQLDFFMAYFPINLHCKTQSKANEIPEAIVTAGMCRIRAEKATISIGADCFQRIRGKNEPGLRVYFYSDILEGRFVPIQHL